MSRHPIIAAADAYRAAHPGLDLTGQQILLRRTENGGYEAYGHRPRDERSRALDMCCCHPWLPRHHEPIPEDQWT